VEAQDRKLEETLGSALDEPERPRGLARCWLRVSKSAMVLVLSGNKYSKMCAAPVLISAMIAMQAPTVPIIRLIWSMKTRVSLTAMKKDS
jgi:hypothetical protein